MIPEEYGLTRVDQDEDVALVEDIGPVRALLRSRKFLLVVLDTIISAILYFAGRYAGAEVFKDIKFMIGILQPVFVAIVIAISVEDAAEKRAAGQ